MTEAPKQIWAEPPSSYDSSGYYWPREDDAQLTTLYIRADIAIPKDEADAMVAAAVIEASERAKRASNGTKSIVVKGYGDYCTGVREGITETQEEARRAILKITPADARAALDRIVQEARDEGYEKGRSRGFAEGRAMAHQHDAPFCEAVNKAEMQAAVEAEREHITTCVVCGRIIDKREQEDGGDEFGAQMANGDWVCSTECEETTIRKGMTSD